MAEVDGPPNNDASALVEVLPPLSKRPLRHETETYPAASRIEQPSCADGVHRREDGRFVNLGNATEPQRASGVAAVPAGGRAHGRPSAGPGGRPASDGPGRAGCRRHRSPDHPGSLAPGPPAADPAARRRSRRCPGTVAAGRRGWAPRRCRSGIPARRTRWSGPRSLTPRPPRGAWRSTWRGRRRAGGSARRRGRCRPSGRCRRAAGSGPSRRAPSGMAPAPRSAR